MTLFTKILLIIITVSTLTTAAIMWTIMFIKSHRCKVHIPITKHNVGYMNFIFLAIVSILYIIDSVLHMDLSYSFSEIVIDKMNLLHHVLLTALWLFMFFIMPKAYLTENGIASYYTFYPQDAVKYSIERHGPKNYIRLHINKKSSDPTYAIKKVDKAIPILDELYGDFDGTYATGKRKSCTIRNLILFVGITLLISGSFYAWYETEKPFVMVGDKIIRTDSEYALFSHTIYISYRYDKDYLPEIDEKFYEMYNAIDNSDKITSKDINEFKKMPNLKHLCIATNDITDLTEIGKLTQLEGLYFGGGKMFDKPEDFTPLKNLTNLKYFSGLGLYDFSDLTVFENTDDLLYFELTGADIQKGLDVIGSKDDLTVLDLGGCTANDFSPIGNCKNLKVLHLSSTNVNNLSFLKNLTVLERLYISKTNAEDYSVLLEMPSLNYISADEGTIPDDIIKELREKGIKINL